MIQLNIRTIPQLLPFPTVFLPGNLAANLWWEPAVAEWQKRGGGKHPAILIEWRGLGGSQDGMDRPFNVKSLANDVVENIRALALGPVNLVGHSTGGIIGAAAMAEAPEVFHRAILLDSVAATGIQFGPEMYAAFEAMSKDENLCATVILSTMHEAKLNDDLRAGIAKAAFRVHPKIWHAVPDMLNSLDLRSELRGVKAPTLVLHGEHDVLLPIEGSEELARAIPEARFYKIPGRGHCTNVEDPGLFVDLANHHLFG